MKIVGGTWTKRSACHFLMLITNLTVELVETIVVMDSKENPVFPNMAGWRNRFDWTCHHEG